MRVEAARFNLAAEGREHVLGAQPINDPDLAPRELAGVVGRAGIGRYRRATLIGRLPVVDLLGIEMGKGRRPANGHDEVCPADAKGWSRHQQKSEVFDQFAGSNDFKLGGQWM